MKSMKWDVTEVKRECNLVLFLQNYAAMKMVGPFGPAKAAE